MNNTFCANPFVYLTNSTHGKVKFCCLIPEGIRTLDGKEVTSNDAVSLGNVWNIESMIDIRDKMIAGEKVAGCEVCYNNERNGGGSLRKDLNSQWGQAGTEHNILLSRAIELHMEKKPAAPVSLEVRTGNVCNLKCRMCSPDDSILIEKEFNILQRKSSDWKMLGFSSGSSQIIHTNYYSEVLSNLRNIRYLRLSGGEPFLNKFTFDIINKSIELGVSKDIELSINSNLTKVSGDILEDLQRFKKVTLDLSLDGVGPVHEYIRSGIQWKELEEKISLVKSFVSETFVLTTNTTIQVYNILDVSNIVDYAVLRMNVTPVFFMLDNPKHLNVQHMPQSLKDKAILHLEETILGNTVSGFKHKEWLVGRLQTAIERIKEKCDTNQVDKFKYFTTTLDSNRNQRLIESIPAIGGYYD